MTIDGNEVLITPSSFQNAIALKRAIANALRENGVRLGLDGLSIDTDNPLKTDLPSGTIDNLIENALSVATSPEVHTALFACCETVVFGKDRLKVDLGFFDDPDEGIKRREYFYPIMSEVIKVNIGPFFKNLGSVFGGFLGTKTDTPTSKSTSPTK